MIAQIIEELVLAFAFNKELGMELNEITVTLLQENVVIIIR